jgi:hypothetical protein
LLTALAGCSLGDLVNSTALPPGVRDPSAVNNPEGAIGSYNAALLSLAITLGGKAASDSARFSNNNNMGSYIFVTGLFTDELQLYQATTSTAGYPTTIEETVDSRTSLDTDGGWQGLFRPTFQWLNTVRARARNARGALAAYAPAAPRALRGHMYALEGMANVLLAELFCSGIPLTTMEFERGPVLSPALPSEEVYRRSIALFDTALVEGADSARFVHLASIGRARALLGLGDFAGAAQAVAGVPTDFAYQVTYVPTRVNFFYTSTGNPAWAATVADRKGGNGLPFASANDPRSGAELTAAGNPRVYVPIKYRPAGAAPGTNPGTAPIVVASGVEARLIEAEAALRAGSPSWLTTLNALRTSCTDAATCPAPAPAGSGGVAGLPPLSDPGSDTARVSLLFEERAHWLFLTGRRQSDLRRLVRQYGRLPHQVYPTGPWGTQGLARYGEDINLPVPLQEQELNPHYNGCLNRDA